MTQANFKHRLNRGLVWVAGASSFVAVLDIIALILILKYWIGLKDFGVATTVLAFHGTFELLAEIGLTSAVIQKTRQTENQLSTIYWINITLGLSVFMLIFVTAPLFATLHKNEIITSLFRLYGIHIVIRSLYGCQQALMKRELRFKELSIIRLLSNSADFIVRITMAFSGFGPWCFIWGLLARTTVEGVGVIVQSQWRPQLTCKVSETKDHIIFGLKTSASEVIYRTYSNIDYWVVSIFFGPEALGLYRVAYELVLEPVRFLSLIITNVAFPAFSRLKGQADQLADQYISFSRQNLIVISLFVACILVSANEILPVLLKPEYAEAAWAARILALVGALRALSHLGPPLLDGVGKPGLTLRYQCFSATVLVSFFFLFAKLFAGNYGYNGVALAWTVGYPIDSTVLAFLVFRTLKIKPLRFVKAMAPVLSCMIISCGIGYSGRVLVTDYSQSVQLIVGLSMTTLSYILCLSRIGRITLQSIAGGLKQ